MPYIETRKNYNGAQMEKVLMLSVAYLPLTKKIFASIIRKNPNQLGLKNTLTAAKFSICTFLYWTTFFSCCQGFMSMAILQTLC